MSEEVKPDAKKPTSLVRKLANVMGAVERVPKTGHNKFHHYDYATESDITSAVRSAMASEGVVMIPTVETVEWSVVETQGGKKERMCTVNWLFTLLDADSDAKIEFRNIGQGQDSGDKAFYKAATGAVKYALLKLFLIPTGDDPEVDSPDSVPTEAEITEGKRKMEARALREDGIRKIIAAFAPLGQTQDMLEARLGKSLVNLNDAEWIQLRADYAKAAAKPLETASGEMRKQIDAHMGKLDADEAARQEVQRKSDAQLAALDAKPDPFKDFANRMLAAKTEEECTLIESAFVSSKPTPKPGDIKAMARSATDRRGILRNAKELAAKKANSMHGPDEDAPF